MHRPSCQEQTAVTLQLFKPYYTGQSYCRICHIGVQPEKNTQPQAYRNITHFRNDNK